MTETLFEYDHVLMRSEYRTPDIHTHLAVHLIVGLGADLHCTAGDNNFEAKAVITSSDVPHMQALTLRRILPLPARECSAYLFRSIQKVSTCFKVFTNEKCYPYCRREKR